MNSTAEASRIRAYKSLWVSIIPLSYVFSLTFTKVVAALQIMSILGIGDAVCLHKFIDTIILIILVHFIENFATLFTVRTDRFTLV